MSQDFFDDENSAHLFQLVHMLQRSAMMHMGMLQDSEGRVHYNLGETKAAIDTLSMMKEKMKGNLSDKESTCLMALFRNYNYSSLKPQQDKEHSRTKLQSQMLSVRHLPIPKRGHRK